MKNAIRIGIFETNSSSSHSFSLGPRGRLANTLTPGEDGILRVATDDWVDVRKFNSPELKLSYLLCFAKTLYSDYDPKTDNTITLSNYYTIQNKIIEIVKEFTGIEKVEVEVDPITEIDHQSMDIIDLRDLDDPEFIREFIFNPQTWVYNVWDSEDPEDGFYEPTPEDSMVLYTLRFPLPGIDPSPELKVTWGDIEKYDDVDDLIDNLLGEYYWSGDKFYKEMKEGWFIRYSGNLSWGDKYQVEPIIYFS